MINFIYVNKFIYKKLIEYYGFGHTVHLADPLCFHELQPGIRKYLVSSFGQNDFKRQTRSENRGQSKTLHGCQILQVSHNLQTSFCFVSIYTFSFVFVFFKVLTVLTDIVFHLYLTFDYILIVFDFAFS
jgi:hypothetical protein